MMIILTYPGGQEVRVNTKSIIRYQKEMIYQNTEIHLEGGHTIEVLESPEQIDTILRTNLITVYENKK